MDIQIFVNRRKELGLSQIELSEGICNIKSIRKSRSNPFHEDIDLTL